MADIKKYNGSTWEHSLRKLGTSTDTFATLPVDLYADGNNATVGISGNTVQSGTPTPDNPIMPEWCGERTGNLAYGRIDGVNIGSNGTIFRADGYDIAIGRVESGIIYTINSFVLAFYADEPTIDSVSYDGSRIVTTPGEPSTFTAPITGYVAFRLNSGEQAMLNSGSTLLPYEPYGYKIPISSASTTTPVYLGEVQTTRKIRKYEFTGQEDWSISNNERVLYTALADHLTSNELICYCSHYKSIANISAMSTLSNGECAFNNTLHWFYIKDDNYSDATAFKTYLTQQYAAGTPVTVWYVIAEPETAVVNEPLMKIGDYADTVSGITIPTITSKDTFDVDTTLKPSEVELTYTGWHDATVEEWDGSDWQ